MKKKLTKLAEKVAEKARELLAPQPWQPQLRPALAPVRRRGPYVPR